MKAKELGPIMTIDVAFPRNEKEWFETLPKEIDDQIAVKFYYGHLFCHVMHQQHLVLLWRPGYDTMRLHYFTNNLITEGKEAGAKRPSQRWQRGQ